MGCSLCRKPNLNESIYELADSPSERMERNKPKMNKVINSADKCSKTLTNEQIDLTIYKDNLVTSINKIRSSPKDVHLLIDKYINMIQENESEVELVYHLNEKNIKITLLNGREEFLRVRNIFDSVSVLDTFQYNKLYEIDLYFRDDLISDNQIININVLSELYGSHYAKLKQNGLELRGFHYDISPCDPEISLLLQLVDDNDSRGQRRNNLLNKDFKYIGITSLLIANGLILSLLSFGNDRDE